MNRKQFLKSLGLFMILPGAGRVWKVKRQLVLPKFVPYPFCQTLYVTPNGDQIAQIINSKFETVFIINQGLVTRPCENPHLISPIQSDRQGEQQHTVLGRAVDPLHPPNDRPVS